MNRGRPFTTSPCFKIALPLWVDWRYPGFYGVQDPGPGGPIKKLKGWKLRNPSLPDKNFQKPGAGNFKYYKRRPLIKYVFLLAVAIVMTSCSASPPLQPLVLRGSSQPLKPGDVVETATGSILSFESLIPRLWDVQVIYVGETHTRREDHRLQLALLKGLAAHNPSQILALEMFPREVQPILDQYAQGLITEQQFLEAVNWGKNWGYPFDLYRGILHWARARRLAIIGLNAPIDIIDKIAQKGLSALGPEERKKVSAEFHLNHAEHREYLRLHYMHHPQEKIKNFDTFFEAQLGWEETMAETLAKNIASLSKGQQVMVLIGKGHLVQQWGVPRLTELRIPHSFKTVLPLPYDYPFRTLSPTLADYLFITEGSD
jgi:uncharacterized iron-regulated protein